MSVENRIGLRQVVRGALTGDYLASDWSDVISGDLLVVQSFGTRAADGSPGAVNERLAEFVVNLRKKGFDRPVAAQEEVAQALREAYGQGVDFEIVGDPSSTGGRGLDSFGVLSFARNEAGSRCPVLAAQAFHVGRTAMQAVRLGLDPLLPAGLPVDFAPDSGQWWTRGRGPWAFRELVGLSILRAQGKL